MLAAGPHMLLLAGKNVTKATTMDINKHVQTQNIVLVVLVLI